MFIIIINHMLNILLFYYNLSFNLNFILKLIDIEI